MSILTTVHRRLVANDARNLWEQLLFVLLLPISFCYGLIGLVRGFCYDYGLLKAYQSSLPIISVGNIAAGGTGKTPVVDWLVKELQKQGRHPAIVSRGYSGSFNGDIGFVSTGQGILMPVRECGDEPYLLAQRNPQCPVVIAKKRIHAVKSLENSAATDVIILDDGFQHRGVKRDVDLVLLDSSRPLGNGWPLPAGNLREFPQALKRADFLLMTRADSSPPLDFMGLQVYTSCHQLADLAVDLDGHRVAVKQLKNLKLLAFAGIADPESFFVALENLGLSLQEKLAFADHMAYQGKIVDQLSRAAVTADALITTEKDGVKLSADMFKLPCYQIPVDIRIDDSVRLLELVMQRLRSQ